MGAKEQFKAQFRVRAHKDSEIKKIIAVMSGKGGVGKSLISSLLAVELSRQRNKVGIIDADITGASIPHYFGINDTLLGNEEGILPLVSRKGIMMISSSLMLEDPSRPIIWRSPMITSLIKQFYSEVIWGQLDYLLIDLPPGTGDVPLTVFQSLPVDEVIMVTTPQALVSEVVEKTIHMAEDMEIEMKAIVQNMSYILCPDCGRKIELFGDYSSLLAKYSDYMNVQLPLDPEISRLADNGEIEYIESTYLEQLVGNL